MDGTDIVLDGVLVAVTIAAVQLWKGLGLPSAWAPLSAIATAIVLVVVKMAAFDPAPLTIQQVALVLWTGVIVGLSSAGLYSGTRAMTRS